MKQRHTINEITSGQKAAVAELLGSEGPATIVIAKPILERNSLGHMQATDRIEVQSFKRGPYSLTFEYMGKRREFFYANIVELISHG